MDRADDGLICGVDDLESLSVYAFDPFIVDEASTCVSQELGMDVNDFRKWLCNGMGRASGNNRALPLPSPNIVIILSEPYSSAAKRLIKPLGGVRCVPRLLVTG